MYFEHNIPFDPPAYMTGELRDNWTQLAQRIDARMNLLEQAKELSGMPPEQFAIGAKIIFDQKDSFDQSRLDSLSAEKLAETAKVLAENTPYDARLDFPNTETVVDIDFLTTKEWEQIRCLGIGGSEAAILTGQSPYSTPRRLYALKRGIPTLVDRNDAGKAGIFEYGHVVEPYVLHEFCRRTGARIIHESRMFRSKKYPWLIADCDGICILPDDRMSILEAKTTVSYKKYDWGNLSAPPYYVNQCRHYNYVFDDPKLIGVYICVVWGNTANDFVARLIERSTIFEADQILKCNRFWNENIVACKEPESSGNPMLDAKDITLFGGYAAVGTKADFSNLSDSELYSLSVYAKCYLDAAVKQKQLKEQLDIIEKDMETISLPLMEAMGRSTEAVIPSEDDPEIEYVLSFKPRSRTRCDLDKLRLLYPDAYAETVTFVAENSRPFSLKAKKKKGSASGA